MDRMLITCSADPVTSASMTSELSGCGVSVEIVAGARARGDRGGPCACVRHSPKGRMGRVGDGLTDGGKRGFNDSSANDDRKRSRIMTVVGSLPYCLIMPCTTSVHSGICSARSASAKASCVMTARDPAGAPGCTKGPRAPSNESRREGRVSLGSCDRS